MGRTLVIGIGNIGRADDGLGWAFLDRIARDDRFECLKRYQLQVEDAECIAGYDEVWFVDASRQQHKEGYECCRLKPRAQFSYTSHALHPASVLHLCNDLYHRIPTAYLLGISGEEWELGHDMSPAAIRRLESSLMCFYEHFEKKTAAPDPG